MDPLHAFESLAGIRPGQSKLSEVISCFGPPTISKDLQGDLSFSFEDRGVHLIVYRDQRDSADPLIAEVRLTRPSMEELPCGVFVGQSQVAALAVVRRSYRVADEYEDAVYFQPSAREDLLASVEFFAEGSVVSFELIYDP